MNCSSTEVLEAVASPRRCLVCQYVADADGRVPLEDLATWVITEEQGNTGKSPADSGAHPQIAAELHHRHLPKLAGMGVLQYDSDHYLVRAGPKLPAAVKLIHKLERADGDAII